MLIEVSKLAKKLTPMISIKALSHVLGFEEV
mgnify:CR=1 FL=1